MKRLSAALLFLLAATVLSACGGSKSGSGPRAAAAWDSAVWDDSSWQP